MDSTADHMMKRSTLRSVFNNSFTFPSPHFPLLSVVCRLRETVLSALAMHRGLVKVNGWLGRLCAVWMLVLGSDKTSLCFPSVLPLAFSTRGSVLILHCLPRYFFTLQKKGNLPYTEIKMLTMKPNCCTITPPDALVLCISISFYHMTTALHPVCCYCLLLMFCQAMGSTKVRRVCQANF